MNIGRISQVMETYKTQQTKRAAQERGKINTDRVEISTEAKTFELAKKAAAGVSDIRDDKVAAVEKRMSDVLSVPAAALAAKMFEDI